MLADFRHAARTLLRSRTFLVGALATLALGVGATTAVFSVVDAVLLRSLPYPAADRLVHMWEHDSVQAPGVEQASLRNVADWRARSRSFERLTAYRYWVFNLTGGDRAESLLGAFVSSDLFPVLGARAALGRLFVEGDDRPGGPRVAVISDALWRRRFGADPRAVGSTVRINGETHTVVGVMAPGFEFPATIPGGAVLPSRELEVWAPLAVDAATVDRGQRNWWVLGKLRPGVSVAAAQAEMAAIARELRAAHRDVPGAIAVRGLQAHIVAPMRHGLLLVFAAVGVVLLVACANVASLMLARTTGRARELALRATLGATRWRIARQLLAECALLALAGGALGVAAGAPLVDALMRAAPENLPRLEGARVGGAALAFAVVASLAAAALFGLAPALAARGGAGALREGGRGGTAGRATRRSRAALVAGEMALSLVLLSAAGLLLRSYAQLQRVPLGFRPEGVLTMFTLLPDAKYPDAAARAAFAERVVERLSALPEVERAASVNTLPLSGLGGTGSVAVDGRPAPRPGGWPEVDVRVVTPEYFRLLGIPRVAGREIEARDGADAPLVAVVNQALARRLFAGESPIGRSVYVWGPKPRRIVGVVGDVRGDALEMAPGPAVYFPVPQGADPTMSFALRTAGDPAALTPAVRRAVAEVDPEQPLMMVRPLGDYVAAAAATRRFGLAVVGAFAALALGLAALGLYSVTAYVVAQRTREIGVRVALGADGGAVARMVVRGALGLAATGAAVGFVASAATSRLLAGQLFGVAAHDPVTLAGVALLLAAAAALAGWIPARRAARVDPAVALRAE
jgi:putative ABC transport system permease protein